MALIPLDNGRRRPVRHVLCAALALSGVIALSGQVAASPFKPSDEAVVLERLPDAGRADTREIRTLNAQLAQDRSNLALALAVASKDIALGRTLGDPRGYGRAEAALGPWIGAGAPPAPVLLIRATLRQASHDFDGALADLGRVLAADPGNPQALLTRAVIHAVRAEYDVARADCGAAAPGLGPVVAVICVVGPASLTGHARPALAALRAVAEDRSATPEIQLWALTVEGEIAARLGDPGAAEEAFRRARATSSEDAYMLAAYADLLLDLGRERDVLELLADHARVDPLLLRIAEAEQRLGVRDAPHVDQLSRQFDTSHLRGDTIHRREEARFDLHVLDHPQDALALAQANWGVQREPADARILLEAAAAAGQPDAAAPAIAWYTDNGVEDVHIAGLVRALAPGRQP